MSLPTFLSPEDSSLWHAACGLRRQYWGSMVFLRGIVEFSNHCRQNCLYCGLRRDNNALSRYRMSADAVHSAACGVKRLGFGTVVLQSGEDPGYSAQEIALMVGRIKQELGLAVTLSLGEWDRECYGLWREAGADRYLLKLETADEILYAHLRPGKKLSQRFACLDTLSKLGYETGSGLITGLPGSSEDKVLHGLETLAERKPDMMSLGPFIPHPETPLGHETAGGISENLRCMAHARIRIPEAHIPVTSALGLYGDDVRLAALEVGNVLMPSLTPETYRESYAIYPGKNRQSLSPEERAAQFGPMLQAGGFTLPAGPGGAWRLRHPVNDTTGAKP